VQKTMYIISTQNEMYPMPSEDTKYYSHMHGMHSSFDKASRYSSFEAAQPKVQELRQGAPDKCIHAVSLRVQVCS